MQQLSDHFEPDTYPGSSSGIPQITQNTPLFGFEAFDGPRASHSTPHEPLPPRPNTQHSESARSITETHLADNVTSISRQLLDSFAFSQVDDLVSDLATIREYIVSKLPDPQSLAESLGSDSADASGQDQSKSRLMTSQYMGVLYGRRCLSTQKVILEYLLGRALQQCQTCLEQLRLSDTAIGQVEESTQTLEEIARQNGVGINTEKLDEASKSMYQECRKDFYELGEELRFLDGARALTEQLTVLGPESVLGPNTSQG